MLRPLSPIFLHFSLSRQFIGGRKLVAAVTAFAFALLFSAVLSHHHETELEIQDCLVCAAVVHKVSLNNPVVKLQQLATIFLYQAPPGAQVDADCDANLCILPPSCGPPASCSST
jgi:hypothetical protein